MKLTIEQLADKVNQLIADNFKESPELIKDGRQSSVLSTRRIRDYITKGLIEKPVGSGREKWFDESHVNSLVSLRLLQHNGLSDQYILSSTKSELLKDSSNYEYVSEESLGLLDSTNLNYKSDDEKLQNNAMDFLHSIQKGNTKELSPNIGASLNMMTGSLGATSSSLSSSAEKKLFATQADTDLLRSLSQSKYRQFNEYVVDEKLGVFLKVDSKTDTTLQKKLLETLKNEIINHNNKENKND